MLKEKIKKINDCCINNNIHSVYEYNSYTVQELLCDFAHAINECVDVSNKTLDLAEWLVNEGLSIEVSKKLEGWLNDGTFEQIINENIFNELNTKVNTNTTSIEGLKTNLEEAKTELNQNIDSAKQELNQNIDNTKQELNQNIDNAKQELNQSIDNTKQELNNKIDVGIEGIHNELQNIEADVLTNIVGIEGQKYYDTRRSSSYWIYKIPMQDKKGQLVKLKHGYSEGYRNGELSHSPDESKSRYGSLSEMAKHYNASLIMNASSGDKNGIYGVNILDGEIKLNKNNGWGTIGIKENGELKWYDSKISASTILNDGCINAFDGFMPVLLNGQEPSDAIKSKWHDLSKWTTDKHPRSCIGQDANLSYYIFAVFNGRVFGEEGFAYSDVSRIMREHGCETAICVDGGGSSQLRYRNCRVNYMIDDDGITERKIPNCVYFSVDSDKEIVKDISENNYAYSYLSDKVFRNQMEIYKNIRDNGVFVNELLNMVSKDLNGIQKSGIYWCNKLTTENRPDSNSSYAILHLKINNDAVQFALPYSYGSSQIKRRRYSNGSWDVWENIG